MKIYFEDGPLVKFEQLPVKPDFAINAASGVSCNMAMLDYLADTSPQSVIYTNEIVSLRSKYAWNPDLQIPEIYIRAGEHGVFTPITELTTRELKEGHNYAKMYIAGEFTK